MISSFSAQTCPVCGHEKTYNDFLNDWLCLNPDCPEPEGKRLMPPPSIPNCPVCGQPMYLNQISLKWYCGNLRCWPLDSDTVFSLAAYEASEREKARLLAELDNAVEEDDDYHDDEDWFDEW